jgi:DNA (cytosine-5)-methyltransferase 1
VAKSDRPVLKAIGITCGIGSMLVGARAAGFKVAGNVEWRKYYHEKDAQGRNTFEMNYPDAVFPTSLDHMSMDEIERFMGADIALGHPECGNFSQLSGANKDRKEKLLDPADIPLFVDLVAKLQPRFFVMDDLPKSFMAFPMSEYARRLPGYDLFPEWVSNWGYGNVQKGRNRMFMIGSKREERWAFVAREEEHGNMVATEIEDLPTPRAGANVPNQDPHDNALDCFRALNLGEYRHKATWGEVQEYFRDKPGGFTLEYVRQDGSRVKRIGFLKGHWEGPSHVLTGGNAILHHLRCEPYTIRERARIQGFPDDFVFYGTVLNDRGEWNHDTSMHMVKQTGKAMPIQFCIYVSQQIAAHIRGEHWPRESRRVIPANEHVDQAKRWYCMSVGYADQERACGACWMAARCEIRREKYGFAGNAPQHPPVKREQGKGKVASRSQQPSSDASPRNTTVRPAPLSSSATKVTRF